MKKLLLIVVMFYWPIVIFADVDERKTDIYFANGIKTQEFEAEYNALKVLKPAMINVIYNDDLLTFENTIGKVSYSYNETHGMLADIVESFLQKIGGQKILDWLLETSHERDLEKQVQAYKESIEGGHKVLVVAHSQGNLFTYDAYEALGEESKNGWMQDYFEFVSVASPAMFPVKDNTLLVSWDNDLVAYLGIFNS